MQSSLSRLLSLAGVLALGGILGGGYAPQALATATAHEALDSFGTSAAPDEITPEIAALTQGVINGPAQVPNWQKCYLYVLNNIQYEHYYGCKKGAHLTYLDGKGNDADQATLLVAMLRSAGYQAQYQTGVRALLVGSTNEGVSATSWLGVPASQLVNYSISRNFNSNLFTNGTAAKNYADATYFGLPMCWVQVSVNGTWTNLQPAIKNRTRINPLLSIPTAASYSLAGLKAAAGGTTGTTVTVGGVSQPANWVSGINENGVNAYLKTCATNLQSGLNTNQAKYASDMTGGWSQAPGTDANGNAYFFYSPYTLTGAPADATYASLPSSMLSQLTLTITSTASGNPTVVTKTAPLSLLQGRRLSLTFNASNQAQLMLDDTVIVAETSAAVGTTVGFNVTITHPTVSGAAAPQNTFYTKTYNRGATYVESYAFNPSPNLLYKRQKVLSEYLMAGLSNTSPQVLGETLNVIGLQHMHETELAYKAICASNNCDPLFFHRFGTVGQEKGYFVDLPAQYFGLFSMDGTKNTYNLTEACAYVMSSMEHAAIEQLQGTSRPAVSTARLLTLANRNSNKIFLADPGTWANVQMQLSGYSAADLAALNGTMQPCTATVQAGGNLVLSNTATATTLWSTNTSGTGLGLQVQDNGNVSLRAGGSPSWSLPVWSTNTAQVGSSLAGASGQQLTIGQSILSPNGRYILTFQADQNLCLYDTQYKPGSGWKYLWGTSTNGTGAAQAIMQGDGNFCIYTAAGKYVWGTQTQGSNATLCVQDDGNLVMYKGSAALWLTNTGGQPACAFTSSQQFATGSSTYSPNGQYKLTLQGDQNLVLYRVSNNQMLWSSNTSNATVNANRAVVPAVGNMTVNSWTGAGYLKMANSATGTSFGMMISGGLNGGDDTYDSAFAQLAISYANAGMNLATPQNPPVTVVQNQSASILGGGVSAATTQAKNVSTVNNPVIGQAEQANTSTVQKGEPVEMTSGTYYLPATTDISLGRAAPRGLAFARSYLGAQASTNPTGLGYGWTHNWNIRATNRSAYEPSLGLNGTPLDMAGVLVTSQALVDLMNDTPSATDYTVSALVSNWFTDNIQDNAVSITLGTRNLQFVRRADGVWQAPGGITSTLTVNSDSSLKLTERNSNVYTFDTAGRLTTMTDVFGKTATLAYGSNLPTEKVASVTDAYGRKLTFVYGGTNGYLASVSDGTRSATYAYNATTQDLLTATDPVGNSDQYTYDAGHRILNVTNQDNQIEITNVYDTLGRVATQYSQGLTARTWSYFYTPYAGTQLNPVGGSSTDVFDDRHRKIAQTDLIASATQSSPGVYTAFTPVAITTSTMAYDGQDHVVQAVSPTGRTVSCTYDLNHNVLTSTDPLGNLTTNTYDSLNRLASTTDALSHTTSFTYNALHQPLTVTRPDGTVTTNTYNATGTLASTADPVGNTTTFTYDVQDRLVKTTAPDGTSVSIAVNALDDPISITDANGNVTTTAYNLRREVVSVSVASLTAPSSLATTSKTYNHQRQVATVTDPLGNVTSFTYSPTNKLLTTTLPDSSVLSNTYDIADRLVVSTDPLGNTSSVLYYSNNWVASATDARGNTTGKSVNLEGETVGTSDPLGLTTAAAYDLRGQVTQTTDPLNQVSSNVFDALGRRTTFTDRRSNTTTFAYDTMSRLLSTTTPESKVNSQTYEARGLLSTATQPSGKVSTATYDVNGRRLSVKNATTSAGTTYNQYANTYDGRGNAITTTKTTDASPTTPVASFSRTYNANNWVVGFSSAPPSGGVAYFLAYRYDDNGNLTTLQYPAMHGYSVCNVYYSYDNRNRLISIRDWMNHITSFTYDNDGHMLTLTRPNGSVLTQTYDANGNLLTRTDAFTAGTISALGLTYDADNRVISRQMYPPMKPAKPASLTPHTSTFTADNKINQLTGTSLQFPTYDADSNLLTAPSAGSLLANASYAYDTDNKLVTTTNPDSTTATNAYDAEGNRISVTSTQAGAGNGKTQFVVDPQASLPRTLVRIRPDGTRTFYIYGGGLLYEIEESTHAARYYHFDSLGSTVALSEANGTVSARASYATFGAPTSQLGNWDTPFQWCGAGGVVTDPNGLISMRARFYHPGLGRFMNRDPLGLAAGPNCFAYCNGNPVMGWDPSGLDNLFGNVPGYNPDYGGFDGSTGIYYAPPFPVIDHSPPPKIVVFGATMATGALATAVAPEIVIPALAAVGINAAESVAVEMGAAAVGSLASSSTKQFLNTGSVSLGKEDVVEAGTAAIGGGFAKALMPAFPKIPGDGWKSAAANFAVGKAVDQTSEQIAKAVVGLSGDNPTGHNGPSGCPPRQ